MRSLSFAITLGSLSLSLAAQAAPTVRTSTTNIRPETTINIVFDKAIIAKNKLNTTEANNILAIKPAWKGDIKWTGTNTATFYPTQAPKMGTKYEFSIAKGSKHRDGTPVSNKLIRTITSDAFGSEYSRIRGGLSYTRQPTTYVRFNDDVDLATAKSNFYYVDKKGQKVAAKVKVATYGDLESTYYIRPSWNDRFKEVVRRRTVKNAKALPINKQKDRVIPNGLIITPAYPLPIGEGWTLHLKHGVKNLAKTLKTPRNHSFNIGNLKQFELGEVGAYVSADNPRELIISFNNHLPLDLKPEQISASLKLTPAPANLTFKKLTNYSIKATGDFSKTNSYTLNVSKDFTSRNGLTLGKDATKVATFDYVKSGIGLPSFDSAQLSKGNRTYVVDTVNMKSVHLRIKMLNTKEAVRAFQGYRHYTGDGHDYDDIDPKKPLPFGLVSGTTVYDKVIKLDNALDTSKQITLNWDEIIPNKDPNAMLFISATGEPRSEIKGKRSRTRVVQSIVQLTDIGLAWKIAEGKVWVYAYSASTGKPMPGVTVSLSGEDAKTNFSAKTGNDGLAELNRNVEKDRHLVANLGKDTYVTTFDLTTDTVSMWRFPVDFRWEGKNYWDRDVMMFTDRNLYKPGEEVHLKGILREYRDNKLRDGKDKTATITVKDAQRKTVYSENVSVSGNGTFDLSFNLPEEKVGGFRVFCEFGEEAGEKASEDKRDSSFQHYFQVQEFRRNAYEITSKLPQPAPAAQNVQLDLLARYYQGTPVANARAQWYYSTTATGFYPDKFRDYQFGDHRKTDYYYWDHYFGYNDGDHYGRDTESKNGKLELSSEGVGFVNFDIPKLAFPTPQVLRISTEITDSRNQTLTSTVSTISHPAHSYFGISRVDQLVREGDQVNLNIVSVNTKGEFAGKDSKAQMMIQREYYESVRIVDDNNKERVKNEKRIEHISSSEITISGNKATPFQFSPQKPGKYILTLKGEDTNGGDTTTATNFYAYGKKDYPWATEDGIRIKMVAEKKSYKPGDTARILVMTPIEGTALITIERLGVITSFRQELKADTPIIEIPITEDHAPNAFVSVLVIRGAEDSTRKNKQAVLKLGYCELNIDNPKNKLDIAINIPGEYHRPRGEITVEGKVTDHAGNPVAGAEIVLFAEDEGVLAVAGFDTPKPFNHFYASRPLTLRTGVSLGDFITENADFQYYANKGFTIGGGGGYDLASEAGGKSKAFSSNKIRKNFNPCAVWAPTITTSADGTYSVTFNSPDSLTRYRVMAVALKDAHLYGTKQSEVVVNKDIMIEPATPRFAHEGDKLDTLVLVQNASKFSGVWDVTLTTGSITAIEGGQSSNKYSQTVSLSAGGSATLSFPVKFVNTGETKWTWTATPRSLEGSEITPVINKRLSDGMEKRFKVNYPRPLLRSSHTVALRNDHQNLLNGVDRNLLDGRGRVELEFSNSRLLESSGAFDYLLDYPYGCVEQTTSSMMPWVAVNDLRHLIPSLDNYDKKKVNTALQKGANRLLSMQTSSGGLAYWPGGTKAEKWASSYGAMGLIMAKQHGAKVPEDSIHELMTYLSTNLRESNIAKNTYWENESLCRSLYVLAMTGKAEAAIINKYYENRKLLGENGRTFLALAIHHSGGDKNLAIKLLTEKNTDKKQERWMRYNGNNALKLLAWSNIAPKHVFTESSLTALLKERNKQGHWRTTWANGWTLNAMANYARLVEGDRGDSIVILETVNGPQTFTLNKKSPTASVSINLSELKTLTANSTDQAFARVLVSSKPKVAPRLSIAKEGLAIKRRYEKVGKDGKTTPLENPKVGDLIKVSLDVTFPEEIRYVVIDDTLPSIFETVNGDFASQKSHVKDPSKGNWNISRRELRNDRALFFLNKSWRRGQQTISYLARVTSDGKVHAPPAKVEAMYNPSQYGLSESNILSTQK